MSESELCDESDEERDQEICMLYELWAEAWGQIRELRARFEELGVVPCE